MNLHVHENECLGNLYICQCHGIVGKVRLVDMSIEKVWLLIYLFIWYVSHSSICLSLFGGGGGQDVDSSPPPPPQNDAVPFFIQLDQRPQTCLCVTLEPHTHSGPVNSSHLSWCIHVKWKNKRFSQKLLSHKLSRKYSFCLEILTPWHIELNNKYVCRSVKPMVWFLRCRIKHPSSGSHRLSETFPLSFL